MKKIIRWIQADALTPQQARAYTSLSLTVLTGLHSNRQIRIHYLHGMPRISRGSIDRLLETAIRSGQPIFYGNPLAGRSLNKCAVTSSATTNC